MYTLCRVTCCQHLIPCEFTLSLLTTDFVSEPSEIHVSSPLKIFCMYFLRIWELQLTTLWIYGDTRWTRWTRCGNKCLLRPILTFIWPLCDLWLLMRSVKHVTVEFTKHSRRCPVVSFQKMFSFLFSLVQVKTFISQSLQLPWSSSEIWHGSHDRSVMGLDEDSQLHIFYK